MCSTHATVFWITGLPRSGKTTLATALCRRLKAMGRPVIGLDGDAFRAACGNDLGYDHRDRLQNAQRLSGVCRLIAGQGIIVVCSTVSLFSEIHTVNRATIERYVEVLVEVPMVVLHRRDPQLYAAASRGEIELPGINQAFEYPPAPEVVFKSMDNLEIDSAVDGLLRWL